MYPPSSFGKVKNSRKRKGEITMSKKTNKARNLLIFLVVVCAALLVGILFLTRHYLKMEAKLSVIEKIVDAAYLEDVDEDQLEEYIYKGYIAGLGDTYSAYYTKEEYEKLNEENTGAYVGIGITVLSDTSTGKMKVGEVYEESPAKKAGMKAGDVFLKVNGKTTDGMSLDELVSEIKGKKNTKISIVVERDGKEVTIEATTDEVEIKTVTYKMLENKIGYIKLSQFIEVSGEQFKEAYEQLKKDGATSLVIDLRDNPGGLLSEVVEISDYFLPKNKMIVYTKDKNGDGEEYKSSSDQLIDLPFVLLVNGSSASASEIFTGVVKDYNLGTIVGEKTFGKGIVQKFYPLGDGSAVKLTTEKYYTPNGNNIHKKGIEPDIEVKASSNKNEDNQLDKAIEVLKEETKK